MKERRALRGMPRYLWWAVGATALHVAAPTESARAAVHLGLFLAAAVAAVWGIRRWRPHPSRPWWLIAGALAAGAAGALARVAAGALPPAVDLGADLVTAVLACAAAVGFLVVRSQGRPWQALVDAAVVILAPALLVLAAPTTGLLDAEAAAVPLVAASLAAMTTVGVLARIGALLADAEQTRTVRGASEQRFRALVQHAFDVIAVVDAEGVIAYISPSAEQVLGHGPAWWVGRRLDDLVGVEDVEVLRDALAAARGAPPAVSRAEVRLDHTGPETRWGDVLLADRLDDPSVRGIVVNLRDVTERKRAEVELSRLALHDALTGLPNRVRFLERVASALDHGGRRQDGTAVLFCDLDGFKAVNDRYGHDLGDRLLRAVAERLRETLRDDDEPARLGGDEFVVLCTGVDSLRAEAIAERLRARLSEPFALRGHELVVGCSIGIATAGRPGVLPEELLAAADHAMYRAKRLGTGVAVHSWGHPDLPDPLLVEVDLPLHPSQLGT